MQFVTPNGPQNNGFCLVDRIMDQTLFVQSVESIPVIAFLGPPFIMQRQPQQPQYGVVNAVCVDLHVTDHSSQSNSALSKRAKIPLA